MKQNKFKTILIAAMAMCLGCAANAGAFSYLVNGYNITNNNAAYNSGTNSSGVVTNNFQVGVVPGASNVLWQLSSQNGAQPFLGTNGYLPASVINVEGGYPGTLYGPANKATITVSGTLMATNASSTSVVFQFASSIDGGVYQPWQTNYAQLTLVIPVNSTNSANLTSSNIETYGWQYIALQQINNPGVAALTNIVVEVNTKPGL